MKIGLDLAHVPEIERIMRKRPRFKTRYFSEGEIGYCDARPRPGIHYAARFAAKEAFIKAAGWRGPLKNIEVIHTPGGAPELRITGGGDDSANGTGGHAGGYAALSITHSGDYAAAVVAVE